MQVGILWSRIRGHALMMPRKCEINGWCPLWYLQVTLENTNEWFLCCIFWVYHVMLKVAKLEICRICSLEASTEGLSVDTRKGRDEYGSVWESHTDQIWFYGPVTLLTGWLRLSLTDKNQFSREVRQNSGHMALLIKKKMNVFLLWIWI